MSDTLTDDTEIVKSSPVMAYVEMVEECKYTNEHKSSFVLESIVSKNKSDFAQTDVITETLNNEARIVMSKSSCDMATYEVKECKRNNNVKPRFEYASTVSNKNNLDLVQYDIKMSHTFNKEIQIIMSELSSDLESNVEMIQECKWNNEVKLGFEYGATVNKNNLDLVQYDIKMSYTLKNEIQIAMSELSSDMESNVELVQECKWNNEVKLSFEYRSTVSKNNSVLVQYNIKISDTLYNEIQIVMSASDMAPNVEMVEECKCKNEVKLGFESTVYKRDSDLVHCDIIMSDTLNNETKVDISVLSSDMTSYVEMVEERKRKNNVQLGFESDSTVFKDNSDLAQCDIIMSETLNNETHVGMSVSSSDMASYVEMVEECKWKNNAKSHFEYELTAHNNNIGFFQYDSKLYNETQIFMSNSSAGSASDVEVVEECKWNNKVALGYESETTFYNNNSDLAQSDVKISKTYKLAKEDAEVVAVVDTEHSTYLEDVSRLHATNCKTTQGTISNALGTSFAHRGDNKDASGDPLQEELDQVLRDLEEMERDEKAGKPSKYSDPSLSLVSEILLTDFFDLSSLAHSDAEYIPLDEADYLPDPVEEILYKHFK